MMEKMIKFDLFYDEVNSKWVAVNSKTGEVKDLEMPKTVKKSSKKKEEPSNPLVVRETNKLVINAAARELLNADTDSRIVIQYKHGEPVIGTAQSFGLGSDAGNKLTKSGTVAMRGKANEQLAKYGSNFSLESTEQDRIFKLKGDAPEMPTSTEEIANIDEIDDIDDMLDVDVEEEVLNFDFTL